MDLSISCELCQTTIRIKAAKKKEIYCWGGLNNCNLRDTDSGKIKRVFQGRERVRGLQRQKPGVWTLTQERKDLFLRNHELF